MKAVEAFAGAGGISMGLEAAGVEVIAHIEIEPAPRAILQHRWPHVPLYGDICTVSGHELVEKHGAFDIFSAGFPCQDVSVAGKGEGIEGNTRTGLFFEADRIWEESGATYFSAENVLGLLTNKKGSAFTIVLSTLVGAPVTMPGKRWPHAGVVAGPRGVCAWRVFDGRWFSTAQRRRRVFILCARAGGVDPSEILLEPEVLPWVAPPRRKARKGAARPPEPSAVVRRGPFWNGDDHTCTLDASMLEKGQMMPEKQRFPVVLQDDLPAVRVLTVEAVGTLSGGAHPGGLNGHSAIDREPLAVSAEYAPRNAEVEVLEPSVYDTTQITSPLNYSNPRAGDRLPLAAGMHPPLLVETPIAFHLKQDPIDGDNFSPSMGVTSDGMGVLEAGTSAQGASDVIEGGGSGSRGWADDTDRMTFVAQIPGRPRRLMPIECERLMAWGDGWTAVPFGPKGKTLSDSQRYRAIGNGCISTCPEWIARRLVAAHESPA